MAEQGAYAPTVTISADEYFDLRSRAEINHHLMNEIIECRTAFNRLSDKVWELERKLKGGQSNDTE